MKKYALFALFLGTILVFVACEGMPFVGEGQTPDTEEVADSITTNPDEEQTDSINTEPEIKPEGGAITIAEALAIGNALENGTQTSGVYYEVSGTVVYAKFNTNYGNTDIVITDGVDMLYCWRTFDLDSALFTHNTAVRVGDIVTIHGQLKRYDALNSSFYPNYTSKVEMVYGYLLNIEESRLDFNDHIYVDLGLPSGTLWATCNVGANKSEEAGEYFAWGETEPKAGYDWSNEGDYKWGVINWDNATTYGMTKYNQTDGKTILESADDAATVNWGGDWRIPTANEARELVKECTWIWTNRNGINGYEVIGPNKQKLFFPASGWPDKEGVYQEVNEHGGYWTCTLYENVSCGAWGLLMYETRFNVYWGRNRYYGRNVRAVLTP